MTRAEYLSALKARIAALPEGERERAIQFYAEYFDDAGVENEQQVMAQLGEPDALADQLLAEALERKVPLKQRGRSPWMWVLAVLASPLLLAFAAVALALFISLLAVLFCALLVLALVAVVPFIVSASMLLSGGVSMVMGLLVTFKSFPTMLLIAGTGLAVFSFGGFIFRPCYSIMQHCLKAVFRFSGWLMLRIRRIRFNLAAKSPS